MMSKLQRPPVGTSRYYELCASSLCADWNPRLGAHDYRANVARMIERGSDVPQERDRERRLAADHSVARKRAERKG